MKVRVITLAVMFVLGLGSCQKNEVDQLSPRINKDLGEMLVKTDPSITLESDMLKGAKVGDWMESINVAVAEYNLKLEKVELLGAEQAGKTLLFKHVGNKQLTSDFVPNDPRNWGGTEVPYVIDGTEMGTSSGMGAVATEQAIIRAMTTWNSITCSAGLNIPYWGKSDFDIGFVQYLFGFGGFPGYYAGVIVHGGILPKEFFEAIEPGGGDYILGVTFTFVWTDEINNDRKADVAIKEIYINNDFNWQDAPNDVPGNGIYDFETVVLHESGHGLSQGHFGQAFIGGDGYLHFAPYALMNAGYIVANREVKESDLAGHCSIWGDWPNN